MGTFGPDIKIPKDAAAMHFWAEISSTDETGLTIDGVEAGDTIEIQDISGICSCASSNLKVLAGLVGITAGIMQDGATYYTEGQAKETNKAIAREVKLLQEELRKDIKHKRRDGYGQDPGTNDYAKNEGGIIVCMPEAKGAIYASSDYHLEGGAKQNGRQKKYFSKKLKEKNSFFPYRGNGGVMSATATIPGTIHLLMFDSKFTDNAGTYTVKFIITRKNEAIPQLKAKTLLLNQIQN